MNLVALSGIISENIDLQKSKSDKMVARVILAVKTGEEVDHIPVLFYENLGLYMYENARRGYEISLQGRVTAKLTIDVKGKLHKRIYIIAEKVTIHTPRYENALDIDDFIARYAPDSIEKEKKRILKKEEKRLQQQKEKLKEELKPNEPLENKQKTVGEEEQENKDNQEIEIIFR